MVQMTTSTDGGRIALGIDYDPRVGFASQQNDVPVVRAIRFTNLTDKPLNDILLRLTGEPEFLAPREFRVAAIPAAGICTLDAVDLSLLPGYLVNLTERQKGSLNAEVSSPGGTLLKQSFTMDLLAYDEWAGLTSLPELLAAFVMPNHPAIEGVLKMAARLLDEWTRDSSITGYQSKNPKRILLIVAAIYESLRSIGLTYVTPPASFESTGQKIRTPDRILANSMGTCLDLAVLVAACLEQAGLHPLLTILEGHAFPGVWMLEESFAEPSVEDPVAFRKRVDLGEVCVFEATTLTQGRSLEFDKAVKEGRRQLEEVSRFQCVIDVYRARKAGIRPLPARIGEAGYIPVEAAPAPGQPTAPTMSEKLPESMVPPEEEIPIGSETATGRLDRWRRKLLDLTMRNRLLNYRDTKKTIPFLCPDLAQVEDALAGGETFRVLARPADLGPGSGRDAGANTRRTGDRPVDELLLQELSNRRLYADLSPDELERRLVEIYRMARLGIEEGGASALYLGLGFLRWYESDASETPMEAPLLLLPLEVHRKSVQQSVEIRLGDDEPRVNVTLLEMLRQDFDLEVPGVDPLPLDASGVDVAKVIQAFRVAMRDIKRWEVLEVARAGLFSFTKFLMWRDLQERATVLTRSPVVDHLVNRPNESFRQTGAFPSIERLDQDHSPTDTFCPKDADSSQLAAVFAAADGKSFVLEGPPGTGKSQTITNLIAHCMAVGKSVLFVSEKMAALSVVHRRLNEVGLGRFCLELHSHQSRKTEVLKQLDQALQRFAARPQEEWEREANRLAGLRAELNAVVDALHRQRASGETVFQVTSRLIGLRDAASAAISWPNIDAVDAETLARLRDIASQLTTAAQACGELRDHPWREVKHAEWSYGWNQQVAEALDTLDATAAALEKPTADCAERLGLGNGAPSAATLRILITLAGILQRNPAPPPNLVTFPDWEEISAEIASWIRLGQERDKLRADLFAFYQPAILELDLEEVLAGLARAEQTWFPISWFRAYGVRRTLGRVEMREGGGRSIGELKVNVASAIELRGKERSLGRAGDQAREVLGRYWKDGEPSWTEVESVSSWAGELRTLALQAAGGDLERAATFRSAWARLASEGAESLRPGGALGLQLADFKEKAEKFFIARETLTKLVEPSGTLWEIAESPDAVGISRRKGAGWHLGLPRLREWCAWRRVRAEGVRHGLGSLIELCESGRFSSVELPRVFERSYGQWWLGTVTDCEPILKTFFSPEHERKIEQFRSVDRRFTELTREVIAARLASQLPDVSATALPSSEIGILRREIQKRRAHKSVRRLIQEIPTLLPRLKPCLLMSPLSVTQYLDAAFPAFDVVVFDEASQIPTWDAVGAMSRGDQAIIVGDPKQLPPTNFFGRAESEGDADETEIDDLESILDDCIASGIPTLRLDWHYRSKREGLIAFSNHHYYGNRLLTFPSAETGSPGVRWRHVAGGVYDRAKSRTNRTEAEAVVAEVIRRLSDADGGEHTIGIVTFSQAQQSLVEDLLDIARRENPVIDKYFGEEILEPVFVKNLENVQGDERDVILFSVCYGPDAQGRVAMNFGPINKEGGERRLNVAITRARHEVIVFSTLRPEQIDLSRTRAKGVEHLKSFLDYAARGPGAIAAASSLDPAAGFESPFEEEVFRAVTDLGWQVHPQVGCSGYRVDLGVVDPEAPGRYLLGIECDGANYHRAKTARDRDRLREMILRGLGWRLHRVWSTDWWANREKEIEKLRKTLDDAKSGRPVRYEDPPPVNSPATPGEASTQPEFEMPVAPVPQIAKRYCCFSITAPRGTPDNFYTPASKRKVAATLDEIVTLEGPVSLEVAARRLSTAWGLQRVTPRVLERILQIIQIASCTKSESDGTEFLWSRGVEPAAYGEFRVPDVEDDSRRSIEDIAPEEIANAASLIVEQQVSLPVEDLMRETARMFGFNRFVAEGPRKRMEAGVAMLVSRGFVELRGDMVALKR